MKRRTKVEKDTSEHDWKLFEDKISSLFEVAGYRVEQNVEYSGQEFDIIANKRDIGEFSNRIAIECKYRSKGSVSNSDVHEFINAYNASSQAHGLTAGILVSNRGFSRQSHEAAATHPRIRLMKESALESELLGARAYLETSKNHYRSQFVKFIELSAREIVSHGKAESRVADIAKICAERMMRERRTFTFLLGDFGAGKTTIAEQVHSRLSENFLNNGGGSFPIILYLRTFEQHDTEDNYIESALKLGSSDFTINRLEKIRQNSRISLILDGFDEVATNASEDERLRLFSRVMQLANRGHSVMLTSRPSYFNNYRELNKLLEILSERDYASAHKLKGARLRKDERAQEILDRHQSIAFSKLSTGSIPSFLEKQTKIFLINPLEKKDIIAFFEEFKDELKRFYKKTPEEVYNFLINIYDLTDLLTRPLLLDMFVELLREREISFDRSDMEIGPAGLYHLYINFHLNRDWKVRRFLRPEERLAFARAAAISMLESGGSLEANFDSIWDIVVKERDIIPLDRQYLFDKNKESIVTDIFVCSLMSVTTDGRIEFSHKSFMEYFIAEEIAGNLNSLDPIDLLDKPLNYEILYFLGSCALIRSDLRLEILQHLKHTSHKMSSLYRSNLLVALMFSEMASSGREFSNLEFSNIKIRKKDFDECEFNNVYLKKLEMAEVVFFGCVFKNCLLEGEVKDITFEEAIGNINIVGDTNDVKIVRCRNFSFAENGAKVVKMNNSFVGGSDLHVQSNIDFNDCKFSNSVFIVADEVRIKFEKCEINKLILGSDYFLRNENEFPRLSISDVNIEDFRLFFMSIKVQDFSVIEPMISNLSGILVVYDPDRIMQKFRIKGEDDITRYRGWARDGNLFLISHDVARLIGKKDVESLWGIIRNRTPNEFADLANRIVMATLEHMNK